MEKHGRTPWNAGQSKATKRAIIEFAVRHMRFPSKVETASLDERRLAYQMQRYTAPSSDIYDSEFVRCVEVLRGLDGHHTKPLNQVYRTRLSVRRCQTGCP